MQIGRHLILKQRDKPYANAELFEDYLCSVFLPHLMITRIAKDLREEDAVLLMDNCSAHLIAGDLPDEAALVIAEMLLCTKLYGRG
jgi:hypothetical protein